jgi:hypothetical protein
MIDVSGIVWFELVLTGEIAASSVIFLITTIEFEIIVIIFLFGVGGFVLVMGL